MSEVFLGNCIDPSFFTSKETLAREITLRIVPNNHVVVNKHKRNLIIAMCILYYGGKISRNLTLRNLISNTWVTHGQHLFIYITETDLRLCAYRLKICYLTPAPIQLLAGTSRIRITKLSIVLTVADLLLNEIDLLILSRCLQSPNTLSYFES